MKKIVLVSDNHSKMDVLKCIYEANQDADYFLHCGDSEKTPEELKPFISVRGNNDYGDDFPMELQLLIGGKKILIMHGHRYVTIGYFDKLVYKAMETEVDICFFGHTHVFSDFVEQGIHFVNPGSCWRNRDGLEPTFAIVYIDGDNIKVERKFVSEVM